MVDEAEDNGEDEDDEDDDDDDDHDDDNDAKIQSEGAKRTGNDKRPMKPRTQRRVTACVMEAQSLPAHSTRKGGTCRRPSLKSLSLASPTLRRWKSLIVWRQEYDHRKAFACERGVKAATNMARECRSW